MRLQFFPNIYLANSKQSATVRFGIFRKVEKSRK